MTKGKLKTTKWIVKFDILKAEQVSRAKERLQWRRRQVIDRDIRQRRVKPGRRPKRSPAPSIPSAAAGVWVIGMRYKLLDTTTTEEVAQGYTEEKMEVGAKSSSVAGVSSAAAGGVSLDTMVQRLVQKSVWDIDNKHK